MSISNQLLFFFSALGVFNGLLLAGFLWRLKPKNQKEILANRFLSLMLLMVSIRIGKSVFFYFQPDLALTFLQVGLSACFFIGPFLFYYISTSFDKSTLVPIKWQLAVLATFILAIGLLYPYQSYPEFWRQVMFKIVNYAWLAYSLLAWCQAFAMQKAVGFSTNSIKNSLKTYSLEFSVLAGCSLIWLAYYTSSYTSYIAGALSFSLMIYLSSVVFYRQKSLKAGIEKPQQKYADKQIESDTASALETSLRQLMEQDKIFKNANLTLPMVAKKLATNVPLLSQLLNDNLKKSFTSFINEYRIEEAKKLLADN